MRFAVIGEHPDGLDMARALAESGRHEIVVYCGPVLGAELLQRWNLLPQKIGDMEQALAEPHIDAVIVAGNAVDRPNQLRRALQSEHHVLCVHPADHSADIAYEAEMIRRDTGKLLFPLLPEALHPAIARLLELTQADAELQTSPAPVLVEIERHGREQVLIDADDLEGKAALPCWDILRALGDEIAELFAFAATDHAAASEPILTCGRFVSGGLFQGKFLPKQQEARFDVAVTTRFRRYLLSFPHGITAAARLTWIDDAGDERVERWPEWNPWTTLVEAFEDRLRGKRSRNAVGAARTQSANDEHVTADRPGPVIAPAVAAPWRSISWQDETRVLELDVAARRSLEHRRASALDFQEVTEEATFKGTMTLVGCGLLWASVVLLIFSMWLPWLGWVIAPLFTLFLLLQALRLIVGQKPSA